MSGHRLNWEKRAAERRERRRGKERTSASGFTLDTFGKMAKDAARAERFIQEARKWAPIEEVAERNTAFEEKRRANKGSGASLREILDASDD